MNMNLTKGKITKILNNTAQIQTRKKFKSKLMKQRTNTFRNKIIPRFFNSTIKKITS